MTSHPNRFFINYPIGSRGDFLINILTDNANVNGSHWSLPPVADKTVKFHGLHNVTSLIPTFPVKEFTSYDEVFDLVRQHELLKIKIVGNTFQEKLDIIYFGWAKSLFFKQQYVSIKEKASKELHLAFKNEFPLVFSKFITDYLPKIQDDDILYRDRYDYIVNFNDLFDIEYLKNIYKEINKKEINPNFIPRIQRNIDVQNRLSESVNYPLFYEMHQHYDRILQLKKAIV